jgi:nicotinamide-nucleotide amidase
VKKLFVGRADRELVRQRAAQAALEMALRLAQGKAPAEAQTLTKQEQHTTAALDKLDAAFVSARQNA